MTPSREDALIRLKAFSLKIALLMFPLIFSLSSSAAEEKSAGPSQPATAASQSVSGSSPGPQNFIEASSGIEFIFIKGGQFEMGDVFGDGHSDEKPVHSVTVKDFYIGKLEVTQAQWEKVMGFNPSESKGENLPVDSVSWLDAHEFVEKLNEISSSGYKFRLPSEAEWEYAARSGGKKEKWSGTSDQNLLMAYSWMNTPGEETTHPVGFRMSNGLGLHDMSGNVREWCEDWYLRSSYSMEKKNDSDPPYPDIDRVTRGGSCADAVEDLRTTFRSSFPPEYRSRYLGLRLAAEAP